MEGNFSISLLLALCSNILPRPPKEKKKKKSLIFGSIRYHWGSGLVIGLFGTLVNVVSLSSVLK